MNKDTQNKLAESEINSKTFLSAGAGALPFAMLDIGATMLIQMRMLRNLCTIYEIKWDEQFMKSLLGSVLGNVGKRMGASMVKNIPIIGPILGAPTSVVLGGVSTYALGHAFQRYVQLNSQIKSVSEIDVKAFTSFYETFSKQADSIKEMIKKRMKDIAGEDSTSKASKTPDGQKETVIKLGERMFGTTDKYVAWLNKANPLLDGGKPIDLLLSEDAKDHEKLRRLIALHFESQQVRP